MAGSKKTGGKRGRPPGPVNARERAQRAAAPITHGRYAKGAGQWGTPCRQKDCPVTWKCDLRQHNDRRGIPTEICLLSFGDAPYKEMYSAAREGDTGPLDDYVDRLMGGLARFLENEVMALVEEGGQISFFERDNAGRRKEDPDTGEPILIRIEPSRRPYSVIEISKALGLTGREQLFTPLARGENKARESVADYLGQIARRGGGEEP